MSTQSSSVIAGAPSAIGNVYADRLGLHRHRNTTDIKPRSVGGKLGLAMFRLDYLLPSHYIGDRPLGRKSWTGLLISIVNSLIVCLIGFRTSQFGFIPANLVCICVYAFSIRSWLKKTNTRQIAEPVIPVIQGNTEAADTPTGPAVHHLQWQTSCFTPDVARLARFIHFW
jgi:hypothetical protein